MNIRYWLFLVLGVVLFSGVYGLSSCSHLRYEDDIYSMGSAQAMSPEFPVQVNHKICVDNDGIGGLCAVRHRRNEDFIVSVGPLQYDSDVEFDCSRSVQAHTEEYSLPRGRVLNLVVKKESFSSARVFSCTVKVVPMDRQEPIAGFSRIFVSLIDESYVALARPYQSGKHFIFGKNALYVRYKDREGWHEGKKLTFARSDSVELAFVESYSGRHALFVR